MIPAVLVLAAALLVVPPPAALTRAARLGMPTRSRLPRSMRLPHPGYLVGLALVPLLWHGVGPVLAAVPAALTARILLRRRVARRRRAHGQRALLDGLDVVIGELRVGAHPAAAAEVAARESVGDAARAFAVCAGHGRLGGTAAGGLRSPDSEIAAELDRVAAAWSVAERHGLALAELLRAARLDLLGRIDFRGRTEAALAGARASAAVLAGLPVLGIGMGQLMGAAPLNLLLRGGVGNMLLVVGVALICAGLLWTEVIVGRVVRA